MSIATWKALVLVVATLITTASIDLAEAGRVIGTDRDLEGLAAFTARPVVSWLWSKEETSQASKLSRMELNRDSTGGDVVDLAGFPSHSIPPAVS